MASTKGNGTSNRNTEPATSASALPEAGTTVPVQASSAQIERERTLYTDIVHSMPTAVHVWQLEDRDDPRSFRLIAANRAAAQITGVPSEDILGTLMEQAFPALFETSVPEIYANVVRSQQMADLGEVTYGDERVHQRVYMVQARPLGPDAVLVTFENVTEQKRVTLQLGTYAEIVARMPIGMCVWQLKDIHDPHSLWLALANPNANQSARMPLDTMIGQRFVDIFPMLANTPLPETYVDIVRSGQPRNLGELRFPGEQGSDVVMAIEAFPLDNNMLCITFENVTSRVLTEEALRASEAASTSLFEQSPIGLILSKMDGSLVQVNSAYAKIIGRTVEETLQLSYWQITPQKYREYEQEQLKLLEATGQYGPIEKEYIHMQGHLVPVRLSGRIVERNGERFLWSSVEDITDWRQAEQVISAQAATLQELSTPLLSISDSVVVMPLVGTIDSQRALNIIETLLTGVAGNRASTAIIDITGVVVVDTQVANALVRAAQAVKLLGAQAVLTGIRPEVAQTLIQLGVDLGGIVTRGTLQSGIAFAISNN